jgi:hypothetical protein
MQRSSVLDIKEQLGVKANAASFQASTGTCTPIISNAADECDCMIIVVAAGNRFRCSTLL